MEKNLTTGSVFQTVLHFSLPYLLSYFLQTLYGMADLFIIGQFEGVASTTAVSIGSQVMHMLTVMIVGLAMGTTVSVGQAVGAGDRRRAALDIGNTVTLFMAVSLALTALLLLLVRPIVSVMSTPEATVGGTIAYLPAKYGMDVIDSGVAVLSMHSPWEVTSKADIYEAFKGYQAFLKNG